MDIDENINYLDKQIKMLDRYTRGVDSILLKNQRQLAQVQDQVAGKKSELIGIRKDVSSSGEVSEADLRNQLRYEDEIGALQKARSELDEILGDLSAISAKIKENRARRASLPRDYLSKTDSNKVREMEAAFKMLAEEFGYRSADVNDIVLNDDTYLPFLSGLELREINERVIDRDTDIKADSSASDFVRLIWAYLVSLYAASAEKHGHHPGMLVFDEPGQHSMADKSVNSLFKAMNRYGGLQCIVAASFDENDSVFMSETAGVNFSLIEVGEKLIKRLG